MLRRALGHDLPAGVAAVGPEVDDPVRRLDHVEVVLDHQYGVPAFDESREDAEQPLRVLEVQPGRRLVQHVHGAAGCPLPELRRELDPLRFPARQRRRGLPESHVPEADVEERLELPCDRRLVLEELERLLDRHVEDLGDVLVLERDVERVAVVAGALAHLARHVHVGQEVHLDLDRAVALARLAPPAFHVEREPAGLIAAHLRFLCACEQRADLVEHARVRRRVRARRAADRRLVDVHDLVDPLGALDAIVSARSILRPVQHRGEGAVENVVHERRLARSRDTGHAGEGPERDLHRHALQVVLARVVDRDEVPAPLSAGRRNRDRERAREVASGERVRVRHDLVGRPDRDDVAAELAGAGAEVDDVIGRANRLLVVLDDQHGVADVTQPPERVEEPPVVALVQSNRRLVQDVQDSDEARSNLSRQTNSLSFSAR